MNRLRSKTKVYKQDQNEKPGKVYLWVYVVCVLIVNFIIEIFGQGGLEESWKHLIEHPLAFLYNSALIFLTICFVFFIRRRIFMTALVLIVWMILGLVNGIILLNRVTPFTYIDIKMVKDVMEMIDSYFNTWQTILLIVGAVILVLGIILGFLFIPRHKGKIRYGFVSACVGIYVAVFAGGTALAINTGVLATHFGNIAYAYLDYGFPYCFVSTAMNTGIKRPINYSQQQIKNIDLTPEIKEGEKQETPNIIMIQLESFFDVNHMKDLTFSENPVPVFSQLKEEYTSGYLTVPSVGAGTANTEFEVISGMSLDFFGTGEYPYKTILRKTTCETLAYNLKELGYSTHAMHNNDATFYGRRTVFKRMGFDTFTPLEYMNITEYTPNGWPKDKFLTGEIVKTLRSSEEQDFIYGISVQGHGGYPTEEPKQPYKITVDGLEENRTIPFTYYVNEIKEMDVFIGNLIQQLSRIDEKTVLVLFGDHLPGLHIQDNELDNYDIYQTEYVIWDNFGLEKQDKNLMSYQLSSYVCELLGIHEGTMTNYHQKYQNTVDYQKNMRLLQYDMLYGKRYLYDTVSPFEITDMRYDVEDISVTEVLQSDETLSVKGENFTPWSFIAVNGKRLETHYINHKTLRADWDKLEDGDTITVQQVGDQGETLLGETAPFVYYSEISDSD